MELTPIPPHHQGQPLEVHSSTPAFKQKIFTEADLRASQPAQQQQPDSLIIENLSTKWR